MKRNGGLIVSLCFKLVRENQVRMSNYILIRRNDILGDVQTTLVSHHRIQDYILNQLLAVNYMGGRKCSLQKADPGFFSALRFKSSPISPTASTAAALGA